MKHVIRTLAAVAAIDATRMGEFPLPSDGGILLRLIH